MSESELGVSVELGKTAVDPSNFIRRQKTFDWAKNFHSVTFAFNLFSPFLSVDGSMDNTGRLKRRYARK